MTRACPHLIVASYNIHRCVGRDGRSDPERIAATIREIAADIVGLQEVDSHAEGLAGVDQLASLEHETGMHAVAGPALIHHDRGYGNAILSRWPVGNVRRFDLSVAGGEPRAALDAEVVVDAATVRVVVTHLGLRWRERRCQSRRLLRLIAAHEREPLVLIGDFNEWMPGSPSLRRIESALGRPHATRTFPARRPLLALDRVWVKPAERLERSWAHRSALARVASDHLPLVARVALGDIAGDQF